jgi:hypothetical protein
VPTSPVTFDYQVPLAPGEIRIELHETGVRIVAPPRPLWQRIRGVLELTLFIAFTCYSAADSLTRYFAAKGGMFSLLLGVSFVALMLYCCVGLLKTPRHWHDPIIVIATADRLIVKAPSNNYNLPVTSIAAIRIRETAGGRYALRIEPRYGRKILGICLYTRFYPFDALYFSSAADAQRILDAILQHLHP